MQGILLHALCAALYAGLAWHFWRSRWRARDGSPHALGWERTAMAAAVALHAFVLFEDVAADGGFRFGFAHALSMMTLLSLVFYGVESLFYPLAGIPALVLPPAAVSVLLPAFFAGAAMSGKVAAPAFVAHVVIAMGAYAFIAIAAVHAILMAIIERRLHAPGRTKPSVGLPPLLTMERLLFQMLTAGFILLTLTVVSGAVFSEQIFGRALRFDHKTVFGLVSWLIFAVLLLGRHAYGWRGRAALNGTFAGFGMLLLTYIGTRFVVEVVLGRG
ncbi:MAG: cytochrome c biogenesis protein CcsA [Burkholderiales bacterium]|nr:cytochrome c biogenesis protein CcsA [Burkholderiales bacterium]